VTDGPLLTVAIPTFRGARHLPEALRSILAQDGIAFDLVVSDDRSDDDTLAVVRAEAGDRARVAVNSERLGLAGNWNQCVAQSRTPFVAVFHQDDVMRPGHLEAHQAAFDEARVGLIASAAEAVDAEGRAVPESVVGRGGLGPLDRTFAPGEALPLMAAGNPLRCSAVTLRKAAVEDAGGFDPSYRYVLDWDAWLKIARRWAVSWRAASSVAIRWHAASETHTFKTGTADLDEAARLWDDLFAHDAQSWPESSRLRRCADKNLARAFLGRAHEALRGGDAGLARACLHKSLRLRPEVVATILTDPRLAVQMATLALSPAWAGRVWGPRKEARPKS
jgi:glycosyltransferase involved in cell wall biosynthesis